MLTRRVAPVLITAGVALGSASALWAQSRAVKPPTTVSLATGAINGHIVFADTNGPARFTKVLLKSAKPAAAGDSPFGALASLGEDEEDDKAGAAKKPKLTAAEEADKKQAAAASASMFAALADIMVSTTVAGDGSYSFTNVKPGTYYVHVIAPGYIDPLAQFSPDDLTSTDPAVQKKVAAVATVVAVSGADPVRADMRLERGADISGRVLYDDGTPAVGWTVRPVHVATGNTTAWTLLGIEPGDVDIAHLSEASTTDDTGHFRVAGLPTGDYILQARLTAGTPGRSSLNPVNSGGRNGMGLMSNLLGLKITVYSGDVTRQADAKAISVRAGQDREGADLTVPLSRFRAVAGLVRAKRDGHPVTSGSVDLVALDSNGKEDPSLHFVTAIQPDGSFHLSYVPAGQYTAKVTRAVDATSGPTKEVFGSLITEQKTIRSYDPASQPVSVGDADVLDVKVDVPDAAAN